MAGTIINVADILTPEEEQFCKDVANGISYTEAFLKNFPERASKCRHVTSAAYSMTQKIKIASFIKDLVAARRSVAIESMQWTREKSIEALNYVINVCKNDIEKIHRARQDELQFLLNCMEDPTKSDVEIKTITQKMLKLQQKSEINKVQISGIIDAITELNSMHGYNETNLNVNSPVTFTGEALLED